MIVDYDTIMKLVPFSDINNKENNDIINIKLYNESLKRFMRLFMNKSNSICSFFIY